MKHIIPLSALLESNILDDILDRLSANGMDSLSDKDKWFLNNPEATEYDYNNAHGIKAEDPTPDPDYIEYEGDDDEETIDPYGDEGGYWALKNDLYELCREHSYQTIDNSNGQWYIRFDYYPELLTVLQELYDKHQGAITPKVQTWEGNKFIECFVHSDVAIWLTNEFS